MHQVIAIINDGFCRIDSRSAAEGNQGIGFIVQNADQPPFHDIRRRIGFHISKYMNFLDTFFFKHVGDHFEQAEFHHALIGDDTYFFEFVFGDGVDGTDTVIDNRFNLKMSDGIHFTHVVPPIGFLYGLNI